MRGKAPTILRRLAERCLGKYEHAASKQQCRAHTTARHSLEPPDPHIATPEEAAAIARRNVLTAGVLLAAAGGAYYVSITRGQSPQPKPPTEQHLVNWSGTHECTVARFYEPETLAELESIVREAHKSGQKLRCVGSGLSPNGLAFDSRGMVSLALMDRILRIDPGTGLVTVQAGARVQQVANALRPHGLTLSNYASIREQTIGGFTQVSAHGTGARIPPVDDAVVSLKLVTPARGTIELSMDKDPELFYLARVGLGCLGVVAEVTLQAVPAHRLLERTLVVTPREVKAHHEDWIKDNKHLRYMWIPNTDAVVVVQCNELKEPSTSEMKNTQYNDSERLEPLRSLALSANVVASDDAATLSATQLRDALLAAAPLNASWVAQINAAEAEYWHRSQGLRIGWSDEILGFDCGGQQWVLEVAFPSGSVDSPSGADLRFMEDLLAAVKQRSIPAPAPIEQRWTSGSASPMSPSHGSPESLFSWVGIIMYLPEDVKAREEVTRAFKEKYARLLQTEFMAKYQAVEHWAKLEVPSPGDGGAKVLNEKEWREIRDRLSKKYPLAAFHAARQRLDPKNILGNGALDAVLELA